MRKIKFRCWDTEEKKMIEHNEQKMVFVQCIDSIGADTHYESPRKNEFWRSEESCFDWASGWLIGGRYKIMQFTGLYDNNKREIYEGDILRYWVSYGIDEGEDKEAKENCSYHEVYWANDYPAFEIKPSIDDECNSLQMLVGDCSGEGCCCEVAGNIFENPELRKI